MKTSQIMCISKILTYLCFTKQIRKAKNTPPKVVCSFSSKNVFTEHKKVCSSISGAQSVRFEKGTINFRNYFKQIPVPFKIYAHFKCNLQYVENYKSSYSKTYQDYLSCSFVYKLVRVDDEFTKPIVVFRGGNTAYEFIKAIPKEYQYCGKVLIKNFNKNLIMSEEEEGQFQSSNICWICKKLIDDDDEKVRHHRHITGKFRDQSHWSRNFSRA